MASPYHGSSLRKIALPEKPATVAESLASRSYQLEMFERSMKENIIVCMETGSGKTQM
jgi:ERCC4-related helicase